MEKLLRIGKGLLFGTVVIFLFWLRCNKSEKKKEINYAIDYIIEDTVYPIGTNLVVTKIDTIEAQADEDFSTPAYIEVKLSPQPKIFNR